MLTLAWRKGLVMVSMAIAFFTLMGDVRIMTTYTPFTAVNQQQVEVELNATNLQEKYLILQNQLQQVEQEKRDLQKQLLQASTAAVKKEVVVVVEPEAKPEAKPKEVPVEVSPAPKEEVTEVTDTVEKPEEASGKQEIEPEATSAAAKVAAILATAPYEPESSVITTDELRPYYNSPSNLWDNSTTLPKWLKDYFAWAQEERAKVNETNWKSFRFLIHTALTRTRNGGTTDRIRGLPKMLRMAADHKRLIILFWNRPFALEEFLMPPKGGLDWRAPHYMVPTLLQGRAKKGRSHSHTPKFNMARFDNSVGGDYGDHYYNQYVKYNESKSTEAFRDMWNVVYTPAPPVAKQIRQEFDDLQLSVGEFATAHIRARYARQRTHEQMIPLVENALNCLSQLRPGGPFFVAADAADAIKVAVDYAQQHNVTVAHAPMKERNPLHIEHWNRNLTSLTPADFYDGFVDIYVMAQTRCVARGPGGFGQWGIWLGHDSKCIMKHDKGRYAKTCTWKDKTNETTTVSTPKKLPVFAAPMEPLEHPNTELARAWR